MLRDKNIFTKIFCCINDNFGYRLLFVKNCVVCSVHIVVKIMSLYTVTFVKQGCNDPARWWTVRITFLSLKRLVTRLRLPSQDMLAPIVATATKVQVGLGRASLYCITVTNI